MDWLVVLLVAAQAIALALVTAQAIRRGRQLEQVRELDALDPDDLGALEGGPGSEETPVVVVRRLRARVTRLARQLEQERSDAAYLADLVSVGIVHLDDGLRVDLANAAAHVFLGRAPNAMVGRTVMEVFVDARIESVVVAARERGAGSGEVPSLDPDGPTLLVRARRSPVRGIWVVLEDVAELRRLQRIRSEFIDNLSHELRTPLTTVGLLAETLAREAEAAGDVLPPRMRDRIAKIEIETGHLTQMVTELLDLAQIEGGTGGQLHLDDVDLAAVAEASVERLRLFAERQGLRIRVESARPAPIVRGDPERLGQVFVNLLHNAVKFSPGGGEVLVRVSASGSEVVASVADQGIGIPKAAQVRIFERFYKVDRARQRGGGTGLGLAIARHVIASHGGRLWVESEEGAGSTFSFALPSAPLIPLVDGALDDATPGDGA